MVSSSGAGFSPLRRTYTARGDNPGRLPDRRDARPPPADGVRDFGTTSVCWLAFEPLLEGWAGEGGTRPGQERTLLVEVAVGIGWVGDALDPDRVAAMGGEQSRHVDEVFLARTGDLRDRCRAGSCGRRVGHGGEVGERLGDGAAGDQLRADLRHVADSVLSAPVEDRKSTRLNSSHVK